MTHHEEQINTFLTEIFNNILKLEEAYLHAEGHGQLGVSITEAHILEKLGAEGGRRMSDVAADLKVTLSTLTLAADRLERKGLLLRERDKQDKRATNISLTKKGVTAFRVHERFHKHMVDSVTADLTEGDEIVLEQFLGKLSALFAGMLERELRKSSES